MLVMFSRELPEVNGLFIQAAQKVFGNFNLEHDRFRFRTTVPVVSDVFATIVQYSLS